jgi:PAS domain S-box-containing protein
MSFLLSEVLKTKKNEILSLWENEVKATLPAARLETKTTLRDSIPVFLDELSLALKTSLNNVKPDIIEFAHKHGSERAYLSDYSIEDALSEYNILRKVIFRVLENESPINSDERNIIIESIDFGMKKAGAEYAKQSANELNILFEYAGTGKAVIDPVSGKYLKVNQTFIEMIGYTEQELLNLRVHDITHKDDQEADDHFLAQTISSQKDKWTITKRYIKKDGSVFWVDINVASLPGTPEHPYRNICTIIDITNKKLVEDEQERIKDKLRKITDIQPSLIGHVNKELRYLFANKTYEKWFKINIEEIYGKHISEVIGEEAFEYLKPYFERALTGEKLIFEKKLLYKNNKEMRSTISTYSPSYDSNGEVNGVYVSVTDNTEQRKHLEDLMKSEAIRDRFISALSHDLRTPLTSAILSSQLIARKTSDTSVTTLSKKIEMSLKRVDKMIEDLLDANRLRAGQKINLKIQELDISELVRTTVHDLETIYGDRFVVDIPDKFTTYLSAQNIRRILENLCTNAIKYGSGSAPVSIFIHPDSDKFELGVHNFGNPLKEEDTSQLFEQFVRAKTEETGGKKGWGIGLSIVKGVTEAHGGEVLVSSDEEGTTFKVILPIDARSVTEESAPLH